MAAWPPSVNTAVAKKNYQEILQRLQARPDLDEHERILFARSLAATPDERWELSRKLLRSLGLSTVSERLKYGFQSPE